MRIRRPISLAPRHLWFTALSIGLLAGGIIARPDIAMAADLFHPVGPVMNNQSTHFMRAALVALIAIVPALIALPILLWRFRHGGSARYRPDWEFNKWYEAAIWSVPVAVICVLSYWLVESTLKIDPYAPLGDNPLEIDLVGLDFRYLAIYPDQKVVALDEIVIPVGRSVTFRLTTDTVMQSFLPNGFAGQIYAMPGMITELNLAADREGEGLATQTQFNGSGFANMRVPMRAVSGEQFDTWVRSATGTPLDADGYAELVTKGASAKEYDVSTPALRPLADPCLFDRVVARYHQGKAVPPEAQPGSTTYDPQKGALPAGACGTLPVRIHAGHRSAAMTQQDTPTDPAGSGQ